MNSVVQLPRRDQVKADDCWDLASLFPDDDSWETAFTKWEKRIDGYARFRGKLSESPKMLAALLRFDVAFDRESERLGPYAFLRSVEDTTNSVYQRMQGRFINAASRAEQAASYIRPEILAISAAQMKTVHRRPGVGSLPAGAGADSCVSSRIPWAARRKSCWPCRPRWPGPRREPSASSTTPT